MPGGVESGSTYAGRSSPVLPNVSRVNRMSSDKRTARDLKRINPCLDRAVIENLVVWVENKRALVTYGELALLVGETLKKENPHRSGRMHPLGLRHPLGRIQKYCKECVGLAGAALPVLPAIVVNAKTSLPGPGFETAYREWYPENADRDLCEIIAEEQAKVLSGVDCGRLRAFLTDEAGR